MKKQYLPPLMAALLLAVVALFFFFPDDVRGRVLQQHDIQQGLANGQEVKAWSEATGESSRWTNSLFSGMPNFQIAPSYTANAMLGWFWKVYTLWLPSPANLLFAMMLGFFIMCLCLKMRWYYAVFGAFAWAFSTYFIIIIGAGHIWKFITLAYIPPTLGGIVLLYRGRYLAGTALTALFATLQLQSNHPQMTYYFLFVVLAWMIAFAFMARKDGGWKRFWSATGLTVLAGCLALASNSASLYNSYEYSKETIRGKATELTVDGAAPTSGLSKEYITQWSYGPSETFSLLIPNIKGGATIKPVGGSNQIKSVAETKGADNAMLSPEERQFLAQWPQYFGDQPMTNGPVYVGAFVLLLALLALFVCNSPFVWALFGVGVLAIFLSWGHNLQWLTDFFIDYFPGYNKFRTVASILVVVEFTIPLLALICVKKIAETPDFYSRYSRQFWLVFGLGALVCLVGWIAPSAFGSPWSVMEEEYVTQMSTQPMYAGVMAAIREGRLGLVSADSLRSLIFIALCVGVMLLWFKGAIKSPILFTGALSLLVIIDLFAVNKRYVDSANFVEPVSAEFAFSKTAADEAILRDTAMNYRVFDVKDFGGARSSYFHKTIGGYHAAKLTRYNDLIDRQISKGNPGVVNMLNAKYYLSGDQYELNPDALGNAWWVDHIDYVSTPDAEMAALDTLDTRRVAVAAEQFQSVLGQASAILPGDTIYETTYAPNRLTYKARTTKGGVAVFSEVYFPWGWTATIDGKEAPIGRVNYVLRALRIPAGDHTIDFRFDPRSLRVTNGISVASVTMIALMCAAAIAQWLVGYRRKRRE